MKLLNQTTGWLILVWPLFLVACQPSNSPKNGTKANETDQVQEDGSCCSEDVPAAAGALPDSSIYNLESLWTDQAGQEHALEDFRGTVTVAAMIFTNCEYACPRIIADLKAIEGTLTKGDLAQVRWLLLSMDSDRDLPAVLKAYAERNQLDTARWTLLHGDASAVREMGATLGIRYKKDPKGNYSHSNLITVLDRDGQVQHQLEGLGATNTETVASISEIIHQ
ncbi:MAG: SCO family protein [Planctomycetota bacterium]|nr:SCO family protein [Planctomycetota bacterium]